MPSKRKAPVDDVPDEKPSKKVQEVITLDDGDDDNVEGLEDAFEGDMFEGDMFEGDMFEGDMFEGDMFEGDAMEDHLMEMMENMNEEEFAAYCRDMEGDEGDLFGVEDEDDEFDMQAMFQKADQQEHKGVVLEVPACFKGRDFYEILSVPRDATPEQINKAYKKLSLNHHPDRNPGNPDATAEFQHLARIHETLAKDPRKREMYDRHGDASVDMSGDFMDMYEYWKSVFPGLTPSDTEQYKANYIDSEVEREDFISAVDEAKGDMALMMKDILFFSTAETADRDIALVEQLIKEGKITNKAHIAKFRATAPSAAADLKAHVAKEEAEYDALLMEARAKVMAKDGRVDEAKAQQVLQSLILQRNRGGDSDLLASVGAKFMPAATEARKAASGLKGKKKGGKK